MATNDYTLKEFLAYMLIYAANADFEISPKEDLYIERIAGEEAYKKMLKVFQEHNDYDSAQFISSMKEKHMKGQSGDALLKLVKEVFNVDGNYSAAELALFEALRHV